MGEGVPDRLGLGAHTLMGQYPTLGTIPLVGPGRGVPHLGNLPVRPGQRGVPNRGDPTSGTPPWSDLAKGAGYPIPGST